MKKKFLTIFFAVVLIVCALLLVGCFGLFGGSGGDKWDGQKVALTKECFVYSVENGLHTYYYNGSPITVENDTMINSPENMRIPNDMFDFTYTDNVNAGTAKVKVTAKEENKYYYGSVEFQFTIEKGQVVVNSVEKLIEELNGDNVYQITVIDNIDLGDAEVTVKEGVTLTIDSTKEGPRLFALSGKLVNNGTVEIKSSINAYSGVDFVNEGTVENNGTFSVGGYGGIYNCGTFENNGAFTMESALYDLYTNDEAIDNVLESTGRAATQHIRTHIAEQNIILQTSYLTYSENERDNVMPFTVTVKPGSTTPRTYRYTHEYSNYSHAGTASIYIKFNRMDEYFYGDITINYEIKKASKTVESVAEMMEYQATGNYGHFTAQDTFTVSENETMTLDEGNDFTAPSLRVLGKLVNNGSVVASTFVLFENSNTVNSGDITVSYSFTMRAPLTNKQDATLTVNGYVNVYNQLLNEGVVNFAPSTYVQLGDFDGVSCSISNSGTINVNSDIVCRSLDSFTNSGVFTNTGTAYSYVELPSEFHNVVLKRQITAQDIVFANGFPTYDGTAKPVVFAESVGLTEGQYNIEYTYENESQATKKAPVDAGKIKLFIQIIDERTKYYIGRTRYDEMGTLTDIPYEILRAEIGASTMNDLKNYCSNVNYARVYLTNDIVFVNTKSTDSFTVGRNVTLDTNGYTLTVRFDSSVGKYEVSVYNYGIIYNSKSAVYPSNYKPSLSDCGVIFEHALLYNHGLLVNNNLFYFDGNSEFSQQEGSSIENHGQMYLVGMLNDRTTVENDGEIFERESLSDFGKDRTRVNLDCWEYEYNGGEFFPQAMLYDRNGNPVDVYDSNRFDVTVTNFVVSRLCGVKITAIDPFDKEFCRFCTLQVNITKGVARVSDIDALVNATQDSNYVGYQLVSGFALSRNVTLPADTYLDLGLNDFTSYSTYTVDCTSGAKLWVSVDSAERFLKYIYVADKITFVADILDESALQVNFASSTMGKIGSATPFNKLYAGTTIDLNGHNIKGGLNIVNKFNPVINTDKYYVLNIVDTSADKTAQLGSGAQYHGLSVDGETPMYLNIDNVKLGGLALAYTVYCKATNCQFATTATTGEARAAYYCAATYNNNVQAVFDNCTFNGAVGAYIACARHIFRNCNLSAYGEYTGSDGWGSAMVIKGNTARVGIDKGNFHSDNGYCVEFVNRLTSNQNSIEITRKTNFGNEEGNDTTGRWSCGKSTKTSDTGQFTAVDSLSGFSMII